MKLISFKINALFTVKTSELNVKIHCESAEERHIALIRVSYFELVPIKTLPDEMLVG